MSAANHQHLRQARGWVIGRFVCRPGHTAWRADNQIGPEPLVVFPERPVEIAQEGRRAVIATTRVAMFYDASRLYRRRLVDPRGDDCHFVALRPDRMRDLVEHHDPRAGSDLFAWAHGPVRAEARLGFARLLRDVEAGVVDDLAGEERLLDIVTTLVADAVQAHRDRPPVRTATDRRHRDAVHELEATVAARFREPLTLDDLAAEVGLSPFHAARLFRRYTGTTIHAYRDQLRVRAALAEIGTGRRLDDLALDLGFASHSHFTDRFRRTFGVPPSAVRGAHRSPRRGT